jgi:hypothetical protein
VTPSYPRQSSTAIITIALLTGRSGYPISPAPEATKPPSMGGRSETTEAAPAAPAATSATTGLGASSATPTTPADEGVANQAGRAAPEPRLEEKAASQGPGPSRASLPPLLEILGRPVRITALPHPTADEAWVRVRETMIATLHNKVTRARATE